MWFHEAHICINRIFLVQNPPICSSSCNTFNAQYQFICWSAWLSPIHSPKMRSGESILTYIKPDRRLSLLTGNLFNLTCFFWCDSKTSFELFLNWSTLGREGVRDSSLSPDAAQTCVVESNKRDTQSFSTNPVQKFRQTIINCSLTWLRAGIKLFHWLKLPLLCTSMYMFLKQYFWHLLSRLFPFLGAFQTQGYDVTGRSSQSLDTEVDEEEGDADTDKVDVDGWGLQLYNENGERCGDH